MCGGSGRAGSLGLTWSQGGQGAVLVQPGQGGATQLLHGGSGHHCVVGLKQGLHDDTELTPA